MSLINPGPTLQIVVTRVNAYGIPFEHGNEVMELTYQKGVESDLTKPFNYDDSFFTKSLESMCVPIASNLESSKTYILKITGQQIQ